VCFGDVFMATVIKTKSGLFVLCVQRERLKKNSRLSNSPRSSFFVSFIETFYFTKGKRKIYKYAHCRFGNTTVLVPKELKGRKVRFVMQIFDDNEGEWINYGKQN
jgi:hypothetical protein